MNSELNILVELNESDQIITYNWLTSLEIGAMHGIDIGLVPKSVVQRFSRSLSYCGAAKIVKWWQTLQTTNWQVDHEWVNVRIVRGKLNGVVVGWFPPAINSGVALWHVVYDDGDEEDLVLEDVAEGIREVADKKNPTRKSKKRSISDDVNVQAPTKRSRRSIPDELDEEDATEDELA